MIRLTNLPVLLAISFYDRQNFSNQSSWWEQLCDYKDRYMGRLSTASKSLCVSVTHSFSRRLGRR